MKSVAELVRKKSRANVSTYTPFSFPLPETHMGIELEAERGDGVVLPDELSLWTQHHDGSLTNGTEYVLSRPMASKELSAAIHEIMDNGTYTRSMTGSTHIHMDMLDEHTSPAVLQTMVAMVYVLEPMLYAAGDASREWCGYANRLMTGPDELMSGVLKGELTPDDFYRTYSRGSSQFGRYYGLNMAALLDYGSLEFRYFPTATSKDELVQWVSLVQQFKKAAMDLASVDALTSIMEEEGRFNEFMQRYFGDFSHLFHSLGDFHKMRHDFRKGMISSKLPAAVPKGKMFIASKVFGGERFAKFIKNPPKESGGGLPIVLVGRGDSIAVPSIEAPSLMVYAGNVYYPSHLFSGSSITNWEATDSRPTATIARNELLMETLQTLHDHEAWESVNTYNRAVISTIMGHGNSSGEQESPVHYEYDTPEDDDFEEEE